MDAHLFSRFCEELAPRIIGGWLEKVQEPAPGLLAFNINLAARGQSYGQAGGSRKCQLCLRAARKEPFLFLSRSRLAAGRAPSAPVMRLRKYLAGHRILATVCCFSRRQLWLLVGGEAAAEEALRRQMVLWSPAEGEEDGLSPESGAQPDMADMTPESGEAAEREPLATWLLLDLREGASVRFLPVSRSPQEESLRWPEPGELEEALAHWRDWPVLTPALRRALPLYDELDRQALLEDLRLGGGDVFYYTPPDGEAEEKAGNERPSCRIAAWPLPDALAQGWHEEQGEDILGLVEKAGQKLVLEKAARDAAGAAALPLSRRLRKLEQLLAKLDEEEQRLLGMCAAREDGLLLQAWLWRWPADFRAPELVLPPPEEGDGDTPRKTVKLDMRRSVRDNMERLFHTARRGQRCCGPNWPPCRRPGRKPCWAVSGTPPERPGSPTGTRWRWGPCAVRPCRATCSSSSVTTVLPCCAAVTPRATSRPASWPRPTTSGCIPTAAPARTSSSAGPMPDRKCRSAPWTRPGRWRPARAGRRTRPGRASSTPRCATSAACAARVQAPCAWTRSSTAARCRWMPVWRPVCCRKALRGRRTGRAGTDSAARLWGLTGVLFVLFRLTGPCVRPLPCCRERAQHDLARVCRQGQGHSPD